MIIYIEKQAKQYELTSRILEKFSGSEIVEIDNYKNIFDKNISFPIEKVLILAKLNGNGITEVPVNYAPVEKAFFFKTSLNCAFDCTYCYLKGAFKNNFQVIFVNYNEIQVSIENKIKEVRESGYIDEILFYASDYSDTLGLENITEFHKSFIPFFENFDKVKMESRTKSSNIKHLLDLNIIPTNTEIAFSLNPESIISKYEKLTSDLGSRITAINSLLNKGFIVGLRFLPLLPINDYISIYSEFLDRIIEEIDISKINSISVGSLLYTLEDYQKILKKEKKSDILYRLTDKNIEFIRAPEKFRKEIYTLFKMKLGKFDICLDK